MLAELANEQDAVTATRWRAGLSRDEIREKLPRLRELTSTAIADGTLLPGTAEASHVIELAARLRLFADSQVKLWEKLPPVRFLRRAPTAAAVTSDWLDEWFGACFGQHEKAARKLLKTRLNELEEMSPDSAQYSRQLVYQPINRPDITTDDELMRETRSRTINRDQYANLAERDRQHEEIRVALRKQLRTSAQQLLRSETTAELLAASDSH